MPHFSTYPPHQAPSGQPETDSGHRASSFTLEPMKLEWRLSASFVPSDCWWGRIRRVDVKQWLTHTNGHMNCDEQVTHLQPNTKQRSWCNKSSYGHYIVLVSLFTPEHLLLKFKNPNFHTSPHSFPLLPISPLLFSCKTLNQTILPVERIRLITRAKTNQANNNPPISIIKMIT